MSMPCLPPISLWSDRRPTRDPTSLRGKPVLLSATGGGDRHSLVVEHQLRPLFGFFEALTLPTAIYVSERDLAEGLSAAPAVKARIGNAIADARRVLGVAPAELPAAANG
jgi:FMN reductase